MKFLGNQVSITFEIPMAEVVMDSLISLNHVHVVLLHLTITLFVLRVHL